MKYSKNWKSTFWGKQTLQIQRSWTNVRRSNRCLRCRTQNSSENVQILRLPKGQSAERDRIVFGVRDNGVMKRLLQERSLDLSRCIDMCRTHANTTSQMKLITDKGEEVHIMYAVKYIKKLDRVIWTITSNYPNNFYTSMFNEIHAIHNTPCL